MPQNKTNPNTNTLVTLQKPLQPTRAERPQKILVSSTPKTTHMKCVRQFPTWKTLPPLRAQTRHQTMTKTCHHQVLTSTHTVTKQKYSILLRKEVIQPHLPVRLPCYDFVPIANPTFDHSPHQTVVRPWASGVTNFHDVTGGVYKARERIHGSILTCHY